LNKSALRRQERGGIDYGSRPHFFLLRSCFGRFSSGSSRASFTTTSGFATATRIAGLLATASRLTAALLALAATEDAVQQGDAATLLYDTLRGTPAIASVLTATGGLSATTRIASLLAPTGRLSAARGIRATTVTDAFLALVATEQVQQRGPAALLDNASIVARLFATATRIRSRLATASRIGTSLVAATIAGALLADRATTQQVEQRRLAALRPARNCLHITSGLAAAAGSRIRTRRITAADLVRAAAVVVTEHSVEQIPTEALGAEA
jgi:hypothetical protein